ncbi:phospholipase D-like domain-containing protein [Puniceicoccus vermicola]|uniref:Phospholipase n=1 Tax=Puniceicoccus vermicola TaxID=388746 RepID=A0A7X1B285_9BACT|nr:phospholipase D-like domain-containing protein [Puniceicoccus vermicola]MBC2604286.1 phospholipase [Puniceicoccus vermicola]
MRFLLLLFLIFILTVGLLGFYHIAKPLPDGLDYRGTDRILGPEEIQFYSDVTARTEGGERWMRQEIFEELFRQIREAEGFVVADFFLINEFAGGVPEGADVESLSEGLIDALVEARTKNPEMPIILISDPLNTLYGAVEQPLFETLGRNGIEVVLTDIRQLRDSNRVFSPFWRTLFQWWGDPKGDLISNPIGEGEIGLPAMLELLNFKANHRKTLVTADREGNLKGFVTSGNPHSASALHGNVAIAFEGALAADLLRTEQAVYRMTTGNEFPQKIQKYLEREYGPVSGNETSLSAVILTEKAIKRELLDRIDRLERADQADLALFYFSDMDLRAALARAVQRGAKVRLLMDPNKDAFGREKNGIPNRQVAEWLVNQGVEVRWYLTEGEQFHSKMALFQYGKVQDTLVLGSANWTRRNLDNLNLETSVSITGPSTSPVFISAGDYFDFVWTNRFQRGREGVPSDLVTSAKFSEYRDSSPFRKILYWIMEKSGASTF